jgi:hypothetical protein
MVVILVWQLTPATEFIHVDDEGKFPTVLPSRPTGFSFFFFFFFVWTCIDGLSPQFLAVSPMTTTRPRVLSMTWWPECLTMGVQT